MPCAHAFAGKKDKRYAHTDTKAGWGGGGYTPPIICLSHALEPLWRSVVGSNVVPRLAYIRRLRTAKIRGQ